MRVPVRFLPIILIAAVVLILFACGKIPVTVVKKSKNAKDTATTYDASKLRCKITGIHLAATPSRGCPPNEEPSLASYDGICYKTCVKSSDCKPSDFKDYYATTVIACTGTSGGTGTYEWLPDDPTGAGVSTSCVTPDKCNGNFIL